MSNRMFCANSGSLIINDPVQVFNDNNYFILDNVLDGWYVVDFAYNENKVITFIEIVNVDYNNFDLDTMFGSNVYGVFCLSTMLGIFDGNFYLEHTTTQESRNKFYDLCCHITSTSCYDVIDDACFVCNCYIGNYEVCTVVYDNKIIGMKMYLVQNVDNF